MVLLLTAGTGLLPAAVVYDSGPPDGVNGHNLSSFAQAESFTLISPTTLQTLIFLGSANTDDVPSQFSGTIGYRILSDNAGAPGTSLNVGFDSAVVLVDNGTLDFGTHEYRFTVNLGGIALGPGTYWLALHEGSMGTAYDNTPIFWDTTSSTTSALRQNSTDLQGLSGWTQQNDRLTFQLIDDAADTSAPEPATWGLIATGCATMLFRRRR